MDFIELAKEIALRRNDERSFLVGAVAIRNDGVVVSACNGPVAVPTPEAHAEARLMRKAGFGATVYVARVLRRDGSAALAKPCPRCQAIMRAYRVNKIYYTTESGVDRMLM